MVTDNQTEWHRRMGPCPDCGIRIDYTDDECAELIATDDRLAIFSPSLRRKINSMTVRCPKCDIRRADEMREAELGSRVYRLHIDTFNRGLLPEVCRDISFDKSDKAKEQANADAWAKARRGFSDNLWLWGERGTGKSYLARCCLKRELMAGYSVAELKALSIEDAARELHTEKQLHRYTETRWLLLDDLDKMATTERSIMALFGILDKRYENKGRIIITSNAKPPEVQAQFQAFMRTLKNETLIPALFDRIQPFVAVHMSGTSLRRAGA